VRWGKNKVAIPALMVWLGRNVAVMNGTSEWNERSWVFAMLVKLVLLKILKSAFALLTGVSMVAEQKAETV
jgi:hypothetical protein